MKHWLSTIAAIALMLVSAHGARAQEEITVLAPGIMRGPIEQLIPGFEAKTGHKVKATYGAEDATKQQVIRGEAFDVPVLEVPYANVIASGNVLPGSETPVASISVGVAVRKGAPKPDISTADAVKSMLLGAKAISFRTLPQPRPRGLALRTRSRSSASSSSCSRRSSSPKAAPVPWLWWPVARPKSA